MNWLEARMNAHADTPLNNSNEADMTISQLRLCG